jgi:hypothetical protein
MVLRTEVGYGGMNHNMPLLGAKGMIRGNRVSVGVGWGRGGASIPPNLLRGSKRQAAKLEPIYTVIDCQLQILSDLAF